MGYTLDYNQLLFAGLTLIDTLKEKPLIHLSTELYSSDGWFPDVRRVTLSELSLKLNLICAANMSI